MEHGLRVDWTSNRNEYQGVERGRGTSYRPPKLHLHPQGPERTVGPTREEGKVITAVTIKGNKFWNVTVTHGSKGTVNK
jgi:hypothetical protein